MSCSCCWLRIGTVQAQAALNPVRALYERALELSGASCRLSVSSFAELHYAVTVVAMLHLGLAEENNRFV